MYNNTKGSHVNRYLRHPPVRSLARLLDGMVRTMGGSEGREWGGRKSPINEYECTIYLQWFSYPPNDETTVYLPCNIKKDIHYDRKIISSLWIIIIRWQKGILYLILCTQILILLQYINRILLVTINATYINNHTNNNTFSFFVVSYCTTFDKNVFS